MKVELFDYTGAGSPDPARYAAEKLIYTKKTRLMRKNLDPGLFKSMSDDQIDHELSYIARTIPSSWEFITYDFSICGVTRAFTHQLVRTRTASYAQEAMRITDASGFDYMLPERLRADSRMGIEYLSAMGRINDAYSRMIELGAKPEDARGILPTNVFTSICMHANLRVIVYLARVRSSPRVQGEYRRFIKEMVNCVQKVHPWTKHFFRNTQEVMEEIKEMTEKYFPQDQGLHFYKLIDEIKNA